MWRENRFETTLYRKETNNDLYINWESQAPVEWKRTTLKRLVGRVFKICTNDHHIHNELEHLKSVSTMEMGSPTKQRRKTKIV